MREDRGAGFDPIMVVGLLAVAMWLLIALIVRTW